MKEIPLFATIPHSGCQIPEEAYWLKNPPRSILLCDVDLFVDELYGDSLQKLKLPFIFFHGTVMLWMPTDSLTTGPLLQFRGAGKNPSKWFLQKSTGSKHEKGIF